MQVFCPDCNKKISHEARQCPSCGKPMTLAESKMAVKRKRKAQYFGCLFLLVFGVGIYYLYLNGYWNIF